MYFSVQYLAVCKLISPAQQPQLLSCLAVAFPAFTLDWYTWDAEVV